MHRNGIAFVAATEMRRRGDFCWTLSLARWVKTRISFILMQIYAKRSLSRARIHVSTHRLPLRDSLTSENGRRNRTNREWTSIFSSLALSLFPTLWKLNPCPKFLKKSKSISKVMPRIFFLMGAWWKTGARRALGTNYRRYISEIIYQISFLSSKLVRVVFATRFRGCVW